MYVRLAILQGGSAQTTVRARAFRLTSTNYLLGLCLVKCATITFLCICNAMQVFVYGSNVYDVCIGRIASSIRHVHRPVVCLVRLMKIDFRNFAQQFFALIIKWNERQGDRVE